MSSGSIGSSSTAGSTPSLTGGSAALRVTGLLAEGGSTMVRALVYHGQVPQQAPDSLAEVVEPVTDGREIRDWRLNLPRLLSQDEPALKMRDRFVVWRQTYVTERLLADVATVRSYLIWAGKHTDISALTVLNLPRARIDPKSAPRVAWQVHEIDRLLHRAEPGIGIVSPQRTGLVRGFVVGDEPVVLLAEPTGRLAAVRDGLQLTTGLVYRTPSALPGSAPVPLGAPPPPPQILLVRGWTVSVEGVVAITADEQVSLDAGVGARLLVGLAPGVEQAAVEPVPLTSIFSGLSTHLPEMALLATNNRVPLIVTTSL